MITPFEVRKYSGAGRDYNTTLFCRLIPQIEQEFVRDCLGSPLWNYLVSKLTPIPTGSTVWESCALYQTDDVVNYEGCLYVSASNKNASVPGEDGADWEQLDKFTDDYCNTLWVTYLRDLLALMIYEPTITRETMRTGAGGMVVNTGDNTGYRGGNKTEISTVRGDIKRDIERITTNMIEWLRLNAQTAGMPTPWICAQGNCRTTGSTSRRWAFHRETTRLNLIQ